VTVTLHSVRAIAHAISMAQGHAALEAATKRQEEVDLDLDLLVVEDNPINRLIIKEQLELLGCHVTLATNGNEALAALRCGSYDAMLTDINLPDMTGFELFARARAAGDALPVIGTTASANAADRKHCLELGMMSCLFKPIDMLQLKRALRSIRHEVRHG
jgi:two-component system capsular synthesis sensor histidine kinase RcsC